MVIRQKFCSHSSSECSPRTDDFTSPIVSFLHGGAESVQRRTEFMKANGYRAVRNYPLSPAAFRILPPPDAYGGQT